MSTRKVPAVTAWIRVWTGVDDEFVTIGLREAQLTIDPAALEHLRGNRGLPERSIFNKHAQLVHVQGQLVANEGTPVSLLPDGELETLRRWCEEEQVRRDFVKE